MGVLISATFNGEDHSAGYRKGVRYDLYLVRNKISRPYGGGVCPYGSTESFMKNWTDIRFIGVGGVGAKVPVS